MNLHDRRFSGADFYKPAQNTEVTLIGLGGIGSNLIVSLAKIGYKIKAIDYDVLESENIGSQLYLKNQVGGLKTASSGHFVNLLSDSDNIEYKSIYITDTTLPKLNPVTILALDNMEARKIVFKNWLNKYKNNKNAIFIDGRLSMTSFEVYSVYNESTRKKYLDYLYDDNQIEDLGCTTKATFFIGQAISAEMTAVLNRFIVETKVESFIGMPPFLIERNLETFTTRTMYVDKM